MKITVTPADIRQVNDALSWLSAADQWNTILRSVGIDTSAEDERIQANKRICQGLLELLQPLVGTAV